ncbi:hypothetical protein G7Y89_g13932 [Cudoniella acicularis]|uniref:Uncharacterized protein n=1 Tax=Cudoniella acicularis TaxID=354080 RepID=A0A8H4R6J1_9HELO|nr:hypothetical protein G7Y89_g13932 [Cudoniella acicularis]
MESREFPLSRKTKQELVKTIFEVEFSEADNDSFFDFYQRAVDGIEEALAKFLSYDEREDAAEIIDDSINLGVRILLMVRTGGFLTIGRLIALSGETKVGWKDAQLADIIYKHFTHQKFIKQHVKLEKIFNARNLERIAGVEIRWTSNLADHLRMQDEDKAVEVFHYASFLRLHQKSPILPVAFIDETFRALALLLPEHDREVEKWFSGHQIKLEKRRKPPLDSMARECGQLKVEERQINKFEYWHDRLVILKQVFDEAEPSSMRQWWRDRRRRVQWYTFWVAAIVLALTIVFGLIQCVEGRHNLGSDRSRVVAAGGVAILPLATAMSYVIRAIVIEATENEGFPGECGVTTAGCLT